MDNREARRARHLLVTAAIVLIFGLVVPPVSVRAHSTVKLSVDASESFGNPLTYHWRATDGHIVDQNSPTTDWTLPNGPGIHFAYVLVWNGKGGYTEGRIAVNTDNNPTKTVVPRDQYPPAESRIFNRRSAVGAPTGSNGIFQFQPPLPPSEVTLTNGSATQKGDIQGTVQLEDGSVCGKRIPFFGKDVTAIVELRAADDTVKSRIAVSPYNGEFTLKGDSAGTKLVATCEGATQTITNFIRIDANGNGKNNPFHIDGTGQPQVNSMSATRDGKSAGYFPVPPTPPIGTLPSDFFGRRDHNVLRTPRFLSFKGLDSRKGGCEYYKAIGAVGGCDAAGNFMEPVLNFKAWRESVRIGEFKQTTGGVPKEPEAVFINAVDLNLTRDHHSIAYGPDSQGQQRLATYVCNHPGAASDPAVDPTGLFPPPPDVDKAIDEVLKVDAAHPQGRNLVACVAIDRSSDIHDVNDKPLGQPFARFLIFGPNGDLLPSINLDGNGEKFVPGSCVACHGGNNYFALANDTFDPANRPLNGAPGASTPIFGGFPETTGQGTPDLQSYPLPYDVQNFLFSSKRPNKLDDLEQAIGELNNNAFLVDRDIARHDFLLTTDPDRVWQAFDELFSRWYNGMVPVLNPPDGMKFKIDADPPEAVPGYVADPDFYGNVVARSCRSCHVAMDFANFETEQAFDGNLVCGNERLNLAIDLTTPSYMMPNAQVTFDRFWLSARTNVPGRTNVAGQLGSTINQPDVLKSHLKVVCPPPPNVP